VVSIKPVQSRQTLTLSFPRACYVRDQSGEDQIMLQSSPIDEPLAVTAGQPLPPISAPPLWQVLVIQLHWRTSIAGRRDSLVADNAVLHWYVYGKPNPYGTAVIHYMGTGAVSVATDNEGASVTIHNAELHKVDQFGDLRDPLVDFRINSHFRAVDDLQHAKQILDDLDSAIQEAKRHGPATTVP
jgi:hypothetical protein